MIVCWLNQVLVHAQQLRLQLIIQDEAFKGGNDILRVPRGQLQRELSLILKGNIAVNDHFRRAHLLELELDAITLLGAFSTLNFSCLRVDFKLFYSYGGLR